MFIKRKFVLVGVYLNRLLKSINYNTMCGAEGMGEGFIE